ncbi:unnamed protein product [Lota lota]
MQPPRQCERARKTCVSGPAGHPAAAADLARPSSEHRGPSYSRKTHSCNFLSLPSCSPSRQASYSSPRISPILQPVQFLPSTPKQSSNRRVPALPATQARSRTARSVKPSTGQPPFSGLDSRAVFALPPHHPAGRPPTRHRLRLRAQAHRDDGLQAQRHSTDPPPIAPTCRALHNPARHASAAAPTHWTASVITGQHPLPIRALRPNKPILTTTIPKVGTKN